jgi:hypothetical protein
MVGVKVAVSFGEGCLHLAIGWEEYTQVIIKKRDAKFCVSFILIFILLFVL